MRLPWAPHSRSSPRYSLPITLLQVRKQGRRDESTCFEPSLSDSGVRGHNCPECGRLSAVSRTFLLLLCGGRGERQWQAEEGPVPTVPLAHAGRVGSESPPSRARSEDRQNKGAGPRRPSTAKLPPSESGSLRSPRGLLLPQPSSRRGPGEGGGRGKGKGSVEPSFCHL